MSRTGVGVTSTTDGIDVWVSHGNPADIGKAITFTPHRAFKLAWAVFRLALKSLIKGA